MKILYVVDGFPRLSESFVINELYELDEQGHDVSVFSMNRPEEEITHSEVQAMNVPVYYAEQVTPRSLPELVSPFTLRPSVLRLALFADEPRYNVHCLHLGKQIADVVESMGDVDLIHAHFAVPNRLAVSFGATYHDIPWTITAHANEIFASPNVRRLQRIFSRADHVITPSEYNRRYLREQIGVDTDISVVPATTSVEKFEPSDGCVSGRLLTVARLVEKKGHEYAVDAVAELVDRGYDVEYHVVGTGEREAFLRQRVRERGVEDRVEFLGHVSDERLERELQEAEVFVLPCVIASDGDRDVAPVALKEAMAAETACVSTTISAVPELITDGYDGVLVEPNDSSAITEAIAELLNDAPLRRRIAENARNTVEEKFDITTTVEELLRVFDSVNNHYFPYEEEDNTSTT